MIATPPAPRFELARRALEAGKHLMLEKPVALTAHQVQELQRLALSKGLTVAVDFEYRAVPLVQQLAELIHGGVLGELWLVKLDWLMGSRADPSRAWSWYSSAAEGGGVLGALGTHAFEPSSPRRSTSAPGPGPQPWLRSMPKTLPSCNCNCKAPTTGQCRPRSTWPA